MMKMKELKMTEELVTARNMIYARRTGAYGVSNGILMEKFKKWILDHGYMNDYSVILGIAWDNAAIVAPEECRYDVCLIGDYQIDVEWIQNGQCPSGMYFVIELPHTAEAVGYVWKEAIPYLIGKGYRLDDTRPIVERYQKKLVDQGMCEMMVPIR